MTCERVKLTPQKRPNCIIEGWKSKYTNSSKFENSSKIRNFILITLFEGWSPDNVHRVVLEHFQKWFNEQWLRRHLHVQREIITVWVIFMTRDHAIFKKDEKGQNWTGYFSLITLFMTSNVERIDFV